MGARCRSDPAGAAPRRGGKLLSAALEHLSDHGVERVRVGGPGEAYLIPGIDPVAYPGALELFAQAGFTSVGTTYGMSRPLLGSSVIPPPSPVGAQIRDARRSERAAVLAMISEHFSPGWARQVERSGFDSRVLIAVSEGRPVGFAGHHLFPGCPGRFGPTGVAPEARGRGLGSCLLAHSLARMSGQADRAWFLWGPEHEAGVAMYRSAGFVVDRRFHLQSRECAESP